jgi:hypothetical protein
VPQPTPQRRPPLASGSTRALLLLLALLVAAGTPGCFDFPVPPDLGADTGDPGFNTTPVLVPVGVVTAFEQEPITLVLQGSDFDGDLLTYRASGLPEGSTLDPINGVFEWVPPPGSSRNSPYQVLFSAFDGFAEATTVGTFVIEPPVLAILDVEPDRIAAAGGVTLTVTGFGFSAPAQVFIDSRPATLVQFVDAETLRVTAPDLGDAFGAVPITVVVGDGRSATRYGLLTVFREALDLVGGVAEHALGEVLFDLRAADRDGDGDDELFYAGDGSAAIIDFGDDGSPVFSELLGEGARGVWPANLDPGPGYEAVVQTAAGEALALLPGRAPVVLAEGALGNAIFDLEGDGDDDVVTLSDDGVLRLTAFRSGGQAVDPLISTGYAATGLIDLGDIDGDGVADALLASPDGLLVAPGVETGVFTEAELVPGSAALGAARIQALAGGGAELWGIDGDAVVVLARRPATGAWFRADELPLEEAEGERFLLDLDEDGDLDVLTFAPSAPGFRADLLDAGLYEPAGWWLAGAADGPPLLADLDGDGLAELVTLTADGDGLRTLPREPSGFPLAPAGRFTGSGALVRAGDFDGNGVADLVVVGATREGLPASVQFPGGRTFGLRGQVSSLPHRAEWLVSAFADTTEDGWIDVFGSDGSPELLCYPSRGAGTFDPPETIALSGAVAQLERVFFQTQPDRLLVRTSDGRALLVETDARCRLTEATQIASGVAWIGVDQLDGDVDRELLLVNDDGTISVHAFSLSGVYLREAAVPIEVDTATVAVVGGRFEGDLIDLAVADASGLRLVRDALGAAEVISLDATPASGVASGDLDGDGIQELAVTGGGVPPRLFRGGVRYDLPGWHGAGTSPVFADLDGDVDLDLATFEPGFGGVIWWNRPATATGGVPGGAQNE